jgi:hypothetical protein
VTEPTLDFAAHIKRPLEVLKDGLLSWHDPKTGHWWQQVWFGARKEFRDLGPVEVERGPSSAPQTMPGATTPGGPSEGAGLGTLPGAINDQVSAVDQLGFRDYVTAFADLIESRHARPPITVGVYGLWGSGKSFLLQNVGRELLRRQRHRHDPAHPASIRHSHRCTWSRSTPGNAARARRSGRASFGK